MESAKVILVWWIHLQGCILPFDHWLYILKNIIYRISVFSQNYNLFGLPRFDCPQIRILFQHFCRVFLLFSCLCQLRNLIQGQETRWNLKNLISEPRKQNRRQGTNREGETFQFNLISNFGLIFSCHCLNCWPTTTTTTTTATTIR